VLPVLKHLVKTFPGVANDIKKPGVTELAYDRMPLKAVAATIDGWKTVRADLGKVDCPVPHFHQPRGPRRRPELERVPQNGTSRI